jgi:hypothetical protein
MPLPENVFDGHRTLAAAGAGVGEQVGQPQPQRVLGLCVASDSEFPEIFCKILLYMKFMKRQTIKALKIGILIAGWEAAGKRNFKEVGRLS